MIFLKKAICYENGYGYKKSIDKAKMLFYFTI